MAAETMPPTTPDPQATNPTITLDEALGLTPHRQPAMPVPVRPSQVVVRLAEALVDADLDSPHDGLALRPWLPIYRKGGWDAVQDWATGLSNAAARTEQVCLNGPKYDQPAAAYYRRRAVAWLVVCLTVGEFIAAGWEVQ